MTIDTAIVASTVIAWVSSSYDDVTGHAVRVRLADGTEWTELKITPSDAHQVFLDFYIEDDGALELHLLGSEYGSFRVGSEDDAVLYIRQQIELFARTGVVHVVKRPRWGRWSPSAEGSPEEPDVKRLMVPGSRISLTATPWQRR